MNNAICRFHVLLVYSFCRCVLSVFLLLFSSYQYVVMHLIFCFVHCFTRPMGSAGACSICFP